MLNSKRCAAVNRAGSRSSWKYWLVCLPLFCGVQVAVVPAEPADALKAWEFSGDRAYALLKLQCDFGPRIPGYPGHRKCSDFIAATLQETSCTVTVQRFTEYNPLLRRNLSYENIIGFFDTPSSSAIALSAHWDTRPVADQDPIESNRIMTVPGANDGASGIAVLLEMARVFQQNPPPVDVWFLCFDAEDSGTREKVDKFCLGSKYFVKNKPAEFSILVGVNFDMVGDKNLVLPIERNSMKNAQDYVKTLWGTGVENFPDVFQKKFVDPIYDDHLSFINAGIPYIDIIDFDYKPWHSVNDTPDKCSAESLSIVGKTVALWVFTTFEKKSD